MMPKVITSRTPPDARDGEFWICIGCGEMYLRHNGSWILHSSVPLALMAEAGVIVSAAP